MKTVLYDIVENKTTGKGFTGGYYVDGVKPELPINLVELTVTTVNPPLYDEDTQKLTGGNWTADLVNLTYYRDWHVVDLTEQELALRAWKYPQFEQKLFVHGSVLFTPMGTAYRNFLQDRGYPVEITEDGGYNIWINEIMPAHEEYINGLVAVELCVITQRP